MACAMKWEESAERMRKIREDQLRCSEEVIELWEEVLVDFIYKLGDELWIIYEQVCIAACDCGRINIAQKCIEALKIQFPGSLRVRKLQGLLLEVFEKFEKAEQLYKSIIEEDPTNSLVKKRLVAMLKAQGKTSEAIKELNDYVKQFMSDYEAWLELADLYIADQEYSKACFCMEELILSNPHNHLYHQRLAEIKYTNGGQENMEQARSYFAHAVKLNSNNMRALFGLFLAASNIASSPRSNAKVKKDNIKYAAWAAEQISLKYKGRLGKDTTDQMQVIDGMLDALQING